MRHLTIERTMVIILFMLIFALATRVPLDSDMWWHLRSGQYMVENGAILHDDQFSYTFTGVKRVHYEWGAQIILYILWTTTGMTGLALFVSTLATAGMGALYKASEGSTYLRAFAMVWGAAAAAVFWAARPQMFSFLFSAIMIYLLYLYKRRKVDRLWWAVPLMLVWGNLHAGFFIGLILMYGTIGGEILNNLFKSNSDHVISWNRLRKLVIVAVPASLVLLLNPAGFDLLLVPFETFTLSALRLYIQEWNPPNLFDLPVLPFTTLLIGTVTLILVRWRKLDWTEAALVGASGYLAVTAARNISFFAVVATPILTYHLNAIFESRGWVMQTVKRPTRFMVRMNTALIVLIAIGALLKVVLVLDNDLIREAEAMIFPLEAVEYLNTENPPGPIFNSYNWGGYMMIKAPQYPVYIDGRTDLYRNFVIDYYQTMTGENDWRSALENVNLVFIENGSPLADLLREESGWRLAYEDEKAVIFEREASA